MMHRALSTIISASLVLGLAACGSSGSGITTPTTPTPSPQTATVNATPATAFSPSTVTIAPGGTVTFAFGALGHSVSFDSGANPPSDITGVNANTSISRTFPSAGTYTFHCAIHPTMTGAVIVATTSGSTSNPPPSTGGGGY